MIVGKFLRKKGKKALKRSKKPTTIKTAAKVAKSVALKKL
jgi:hypothetical protein